MTLLHYFSKMMSYELLVLVLHKLLSTLVKKHHLLWQEVRCNCANLVGGSMGVHWGYTVHNY